ncbi:MAG TPA: PEP/pyruvate-binding domain-containing protein [Gemmatimonadaceae bacterium]|nr:PEP/pyruvate-binding domain-containing protein [Gemmatimonadaceae bacterium]
MDTSAIPVATETALAPSGAPWIRWFSEIDAADVQEVGGKNASLGEMRRQLAAVGIPVPDGSAITATAFRAYLRHNNLEDRIRSELASGVSHDDRSRLGAAHEEKRRGRYRARRSDLARGHRGAGTSTLTLFCGHDSAWRRWNAARRRNSDPRAAVA